MSNNSQALETGIPKGTMTGYVYGFILSLIITLGAYWLVRIHVNSHHLHPSDTIVMAALPALAVLQLFVQLRLFLHLGKGRKPRWNLLIFSFALIVVIILVAGSLWIMHNLNYRMNPTQINKYMQIQNGGI